MATIGNVSAQRTITPFTKRVLNSVGTKVYVQPQQKQQRNVAITFGYGYSPVTSHDKYSHARFSYNYSDDMGIVESSTGAISVGVNYEITPWLVFNIAFMYSENEGIQPF